jgi:hypothetical protein
MEKGELMEPVFYQIGRYWINLSTILWVEKYEDRKGITLGVIYQAANTGRGQLVLEGDEVQEMINILNKNTTLPPPA